MEAIIKIFDPRTHEHNAAARFLLVAGGFLLPIKLSLAYVCLLPVVILFAIDCIVHRRSPYAVAPACLVPLFLFFVVAMVSGLLGVNPTRSVFTAASAFGMTLLIGAVNRYVGSPAMVIAALAVGQTITALHSVIDWWLPDTLPWVFVGPVSESGQLALLLPLLVSLYLLPRDSQGMTNTLRAWCAAHVLLLLLTLSAPFVHSAVPIEAICFTLLATGAIAGAVVICRSMTAHRHSAALLQFVLLFAVPLLSTALLVNLKRGPWLGVVAAIVLLLLSRSKRLLLVPLFGAVVASLLFIPLFRDRLFASKDHFFISGGRSEIWSVGWELATSYPLGIGFHNSPVLRNFSATIPPELRHFHSNLINVVVETGWIGGALFVWWLWNLLRLGFLHRRKTAATAELPLDLPFALALSIFAWQISGLVEYNVGDSEVLLMAYLLIGLLSKSEEVTQPSPEVRFAPDASAALCHQRPAA